MFRDLISRVIGRSKPHVKRPCPVCGKEVRWEPECPRYPRDRGESDRWMCCFPACGNADGYECSDADCEWPGYIDGLSISYEASQRSSNAGRRPNWLPDKAADGGGGESV